MKITAKKLHKIATWQKKINPSEYSDAIKEILSNAYIAAKDKEFKLNIKYELLTNSDFKILFGLGFKLNAVRNYLEHGYFITWELTW